MKTHCTEKAALVAALLLALAAPALFSCGGEAPDHHQREPMESDYRTVKQRVTLTNLDNGCSTAGTQGISAQLLDEMQCLTNGALVPVSHPNLEETSNRVHLYLSPSGRTALRSAADRATIRINSALRTIAEQFVLWEGCSVAATPGESNHETGRAIDVDNWQSVESILESEGFSHPLPDSDPVHFEGPGPDLREYSILAFQKLWNANHPNDPIAEDGITGPETLSRLEKAPAGGFQVGSVCTNDDGTTDAGADADASMTGDTGRVDTGRPDSGSDTATRTDTFEVDTSPDAGTYDTGAYVDTSAPASNQKSSVTTRSTCSAGSGSPAAPAELFLALLPLAAARWLLSRRS